MKTKYMSEYTGRAVAELQVFADPKVDDTYALRATMKGRGMRTLDFLIVGSQSGVTGGCRQMLPHQVADSLEECMFSSWPPPVGKLKFFV